MIWNEEAFVKNMILNQNFFLLSAIDLKFYVSDSETNLLRKSTTCTFHIAFLHLTMYSYSLQHLRQLD